MLSENGRALARSVRVEHKVEHKKYKKMLKNIKMGIEKKRYMVYKTTIVIYSILLYISLGDFL